MQTKPSLEVLEHAFDQGRLKYPGRKRGMQTEFANLRKKHPKDWKEIAEKLCDLIDLYERMRQKEIATKGWTPDWPHFSTFINQRRFEEGLNQ